MQADFLTHFLKVFSFALSPTFSVQLPTFWSSVGGKAGKSYQKSCTHCHPAWLVLYDSFSVSLFCRFFLKLESFQQSVSLSLLNFKPWRVPLVTWNHFEVYLFNLTKFPLLGSNANSYIKQPFLVTKQKYY